MGRGASLIKNFSNRRIKKGMLVRMPGSNYKIKDPGWEDLTYRKVQIVPHEKGVTRGKRVVTKTTYHGVKNEDNLSKRKLKKEFQSEGHGNIVPHYTGAGHPHYLGVTQKKTTKFHDSRRWHDDVQDRKKKQVEYTRGNTLADQIRDTHREDKTTYRSKTKHLRANKEGKEIVKKRMADAGIQGVKNLRIRGKVQRESSWNEECVDGCGSKFAGATGNQELKSTKVFKYKKGTQANDAFRKSNQSNPKMMSDIIPGTVKKIRRKDYGDEPDRSSRASTDNTWNKQASQFKADKGKFSKLKVKTYEGKTHKFRQNVFSKGTVNNSEIAFQEGDVQWITKKDFKDAKKFDRQRGGTEWKRYKQTGIPDREHKRIYVARKNH